MTNVKQGDTSIGVLTIGHALAGFMPHFMANVKQGDTSIVPFKLSAHSASRKPLHCGSEAVQVLACEAFMRSCLHGLQRSL